MAGFSKPLTLNADEKIRQQQLEEFEKNYTAMRDAKITLDVQLYLTGAVRGIATAEDAAVAEKAAAADEKACIERIKKMNTDADLTTLLEMGLADDAFIKQLATFDPKTAGYTNVMDMLAYKAKDLGDGLYVKLDSKGEQFFIITNDNAENTKKVIEAQKNREVIEWSNVAPANTERHAEIQKLCLAAGKRVIINGQETPLSKAMPHGDPENYTRASPISS